MIHEYRIHKAMKIDYNYDYSFKEDSYSTEKSQTSIFYS